jgi:hypothetical protein
VTTGYPTAETRVAVTNNGTILQTPAILNIGPVYPLGVPLSFTGVAISSNKGSTWNGVCPAPQGMPCPAPYYLDDQLYMDRDTGRFFWNFLLAENGGTALVWTDDAGATWGFTYAWPFPATENPHVLTGIPRTSTTTGYPKVVYFCGNLGLIGGAASQGDVILGSTPTRTPAARLCEKSLDGGKTFIVSGQGFLFSRPAAVHPECRSAPDEDSGYPTAAVDGSLYLVISCGGKRYLARSTDEGASWPIIKTTQAPPALGGSFEPTPGLMMDSANNLYLAWEANQSNPITGSKGQLVMNLAISNNLGQTWRILTHVTAPGITLEEPWDVAVRAPGQVAFSYYGQQGGKTSWDGFLTYTSDALDPNPVFRAAALNAPSQPLMYGPPTTAGVATGPTADPMDRPDYIGVDIGPDGTPWASFVKECGTDPTAPACLAEEPNHTTRTAIGFLGHLYRPAAPQASKS